MNKPLTGITIVEAATFVAGPSAGMALGQLGAEVVRVDLPAGGSDLGRWPLAPSGSSLYWIGLNKGKKSVLIDYRQPAGRELLLALATLPGPSSGIFVDNMVGRTRLTTDELSARRADTIHVRVQGRADGGPSIDYTANAAVGLPEMTGEPTGGPVNHVLPAWDLLTGMTAATGILAALHRRHVTGEGASIEIALDDVALSAVGALGWLAAALYEGTSRPQLGNFVYGSFGVDFATKDGERVMVIALTTGHWHGLVEATGTTAAVSALSRSLGVDLDEESERFRHREAIFAILEPWFARHSLDEVGRALDAARVLWGPYVEMMAAALRARQSPLAFELEQPGVGTMLATASPLRWEGAVTAPLTAPVLGADTEAVLSKSLGLSDREIATLVDQRIVAAAGRVGAP